MATSYGTLMTFDTLASTNQTVVQIGEDNVWDALDAEIAVQNRWVSEVTSLLASPTQQRLRRYGNFVDMEFEDISELGVPGVQKFTAGATVGFPLYNYGLGIQWTKKYFRNATGAELAANFRGVILADRKLVIKKMKTALFKATNNDTYVDRLVDNVTLPIKALANADSQPLPLGPNGEVFDASTHTHYLATASLTANNLRSQLSTVSEHFDSGSLKLFIPSTSETAIAAFTGTNEFRYYPDPRIRPAASAEVVIGNTLDINNVYDRAIGIFGNAEVIVKPWMPANYLAAVMVGIGQSPLVIRTRPGSPGLELASEDERHPLRARLWEHEFGMSVWNRVQAAILYTGGGTYVSPTFS